MVVSGGEFVRFLVEEFVGGRNCRKVGGIQF